MIFVDFTQASKGEARADAQAFKNFNALIAADLSAQRANEYFQGAPGRMAAINLESNRQVGLANTLAPDLNSIIQADANQILGQAATRSVAGLLASQTAQFTLPNIPALAQNAAGTQLANSANTNFQATTLTPQTQRIAQGQNTHTLSQQPTQFAYEASQNQFALQQQPQAQQIAAGTQQLQLDLQAGEREYALAYQQYQQAVLNGQQADLPTVQRLQQAQRNVDLLRTQYNRGQVTQQIADQPAASRLQTVQRELAQMQAEAAQRNLPLDQAYADKLREYNTLVTQGNIAVQPTLSATRVIQAQGDLDRAPQAQQIQNTQQDIRASEVDFTKSRIVTQQNMAVIKDAIAKNQLKWEELNQEDQQAIQTDNLVVAKHNANLARQFLPQRTKIETLQMGNTLAEAEQTQKLAGYARTAQEIKAKDSVPAATAAANEAAYKRQIFAGIRALQGLTRFSPTSVSQETMSQTMRVLKDNKLANEGDTMGAGPAGIYIRTASGEQRPIAPMLNGLIREANPKAEVKTTPPKYTWDSWVDSDGNTHNFVRAVFTGAPTPEQIAQLEKYNSDRGLKTPPGGAAAPAYTNPFTVQGPPQQIAPAVRTQ